MPSSVSIIYWTGPHRMRLVRFRGINPFHWLWYAYDVLRSTLRHAMRSLEPPSPKRIHSHNATSDDLNLMGVRISLRIPHTTFTPNSYDNFGNGHRDDEVTCATFRRIQHFRYTLQSWDKQVCLFSPQTVLECILGTMDRLCSQNPNKDVTVVPDLCIASEHDPIVFPHPSSDPERATALSATVHYAVFYHDRSVRIKDMLLGSPEEVFATLASNPSIIPCLVSLTSDYTVAETFLGDCPVSRPVVAAARALAARTGANEVRVCVSDGDAFTLGVLVHASTLHAGTPWETAWGIPAGNIGQYVPVEDGEFVFIPVLPNFACRMLDCRRPPVEEEEPEWRNNVALIMSALAIWMDGEEKIWNYVECRRPVSEEDRVARLLADFAAPTRRSSTATTLPLDLPVVDVPIDSPPGAIEGAE